MKRSLKEFTGYLLTTQDGKTAKVKDFLFDEKQWMIRYLEADFGGWLSPNKILIPKVFLKQPPFESDVFPTEISSSDIENCPKIGEHLPVSRKYEEMLHEHYQLNPYWLTPYVATSGSFYPPRPVKIPKTEAKEENVDSILRSFKEISGYQIKSLTEVFGQVDDVIIDDVDWQVVYLVIDTNLWLPWSKKVIIGVENLNEIIYTMRTVKINLSTDAIKDAPEFDPDKLIDEKYEQSIIDFYSSSLVK